MDAADAKKALLEAGIEQKADECVKVVVRCRPLNTKERKEGRKKIVDVDTKNGVIKVKDPSAGPRAPPNTYTFDQTYDESTVQINLYNASVAPLVESVIDGCVVVPNAAFGRCFCSCCRFNGHAMDASSAVLSLSVVLC